MTRNLSLARAIAIGLASVVAAAGGLVADDTGSLYYEVDDGRLVITNSPGGAAARPLPGWERARTARPAAAMLAASRWDPYIGLAAQQAGISPLLLKAVARVESGFDPRARSPKGALGLMQLMPATAERYGVSDPFDAWQSLQAGATHLRHLLDTFGSVDLALAAYNAGAGAVRRHGGVPDYAETRHYVRKVRGLLGAVARPRSASAPQATRAASTLSEVRIERSADGSFVISN